MERLSQSLAELAARAKSLEDSVAAVREENSAKLQARRQEIEDSFDRDVKEFDAAASNVSGKVRQWWMDTKGSVDQHINEMRTDFEERKADHEVERAERSADRAEEEAIVAIAVATYYLNVAEYAVVDAVLARADAESLMAAR
jgi:uncharacterized protein YeeX (DUF496 family)